MAVFSAIGAAIAGAFGAIFGAGAFATFLVNTLAQIATSFLVGLLMKKDTPEVFGTSGKLQGGDDVPRSFPVGVGFTEGSLVYASYWGRSGETRNAYFTQVIALSDLPIKGVVAVTVDGIYCTPETSAATDRPSLGDMLRTAFGSSNFLSLTQEYEGPATPDAEDFGVPLREYREDGQDHAWVKIYDGTQTVADPLLIEFAQHPDNPWTAQHIGTGVAYAVCTVRANNRLFSGFPRFGFVVDSARLYNPAKDSTVGGDGPHRWDNPSTWGGEGDYSPVVQAYNVLRGISYNGRWLYGFQGVSAGRLPAAAWINEINKCKVLVPTPEGQRPAFRAGGILPVSAECGNALQAIMASCGGRIAEIGGIYKPLAAGPNAPVMHIDEFDIIASEGHGFQPITRLADRINAITAQYPAPEEGFTMKAATPLFRPDLEADDGGRRLPGELNLANVPYVDQVSRLMDVALKEARRDRRHAFVLPPRFYRLEPLDTVTFTSPQRGYENKSFIVQSAAIRGDCHVMVELVELDPDDYDFSLFDRYPDEPPALLQPITPVSAGLIGLTATASSIRDASGDERRPAIVVAWDGAQATQFSAVVAQVRVKVAGSTAFEVTTAQTQAPLWIIEGILPGTEYEVRAAPVWNGRAEWSPFYSVTTPDVRLQPSDLSAEIRSELDASAEEFAKKFGIEAVETFPTTGLRVDQIVIKKPELTLYRWDGSQWTTQLFAGVAPGAVNIASFANGIRPVEIVDALPVTGNVTGRTVFLTTDSKNYRWTGTAWTAAVPAVDVTGQLTDAQIAAVAAAKLTGQITAPQIADGAVTDAKVAGLAAGKITGQLSDAQIAAIAAAKVTGQLTGAQIADAAIGVAKFAAGLRPVEVLSALPTTGNFAGRMVFLTTDSKLYRHNGTAFVASIAASDIAGQVQAAQVAALEASKITGQLTDAQIAAIAAAKVTGQISTSQIADAALTVPKFAAGLRPVEIVATLPTTGNVTGRTVVLTTDGKLYRWTGSAWTASVPTSDLTGTLSDAQIAAISAAKVTGQITGTQIADGAISTAKLLAGSVSTAALAAGAVTADQIASNAITAVKIAAGAVVADKLAANAVTANAIAAGAVTAGKVAADAITATEIASGSVTTAKIAAGAVTANEIGANAVTAVKISAGAVETAKIATGAVQAGQIAAGAVTADKVAANAITASAIAAGAVTAGKIAAGAVTATEIAAGAVTASRLAIGDFSNIVPNGDMTDASAWSTSMVFFPVFGTTGWVFDSPVAYEFAWVSGQTGFSQPLSSSQFSVQAGRPYAFRYQTFASGGITYRHWGRVHWRDAAGIDLPGSPVLLAYTTIAAVTNTGGSIIEHTAMLTPPADAKFGIIRFYCERGPTTGPFRIGSVSCRRAASGELIVDGAITAGKIAAGAVTASAILAGSVSTAALAAGSVTADTIASNAVTAAKISAGAVETAKIAAGAVQADQIAAGAVTAGKIAANAVTATEIAAGAITAVKLAAGSVSTAALAAGSVTADQIAANAVTTAKINTGAVTANEVATNAITAVKIAADAVTAGKIAAAAVNTREIAAGAIHTEKLSVLSREYVNPVSVTGNLHGWGGVLEDGTGSGPGLSYNSADRAIQLAGTLDHSVRSRTFRIDHNKIYRVAARVRKNIAGGTYWIGIQAASVDTEGLTQAENGIISGSLAVQEFSAARAAAGNSNNPYFARGIAATTAFVDHVYFIVGANRSLADCPAHVGPGLTPFVQLPASAAFVALRFLNWENAGTARNLLVRDVSVTEIGTGQIVADNIAANAITGDKITANAIGADQIAANAVTAAKIAANAVTADKISVANLSALSANMGTVTAGTLQSPNYVAGSTGTRINMNTGAAEFNNVVLSRPLVLAEGQFTAPIAASYPFVNTGIRIGDGDIWALQNRALVAVARIAPPISASGSPGNGALWGVRAEIVQGGKWLGTSNWGAGQGFQFPWTQDPATLVTPSWATGTFQRVLLNINTQQSLLSITGNVNIGWKVFQVT